MKKQQQRKKLLPHLLGYRQNFTNFHFYPLYLYLIQIQIILFSAMSAFKAIFMAKIQLQKYKCHINAIKTKQTKTASHTIQDNFLLTG